LDQQQFRISIMPISHGTADCKPVRDRLPNKRDCETIAFERDGSHYRMTVGFYPDGRLGEIFLNHDRGDSLLDVWASDAAILASLALQHGCTLETIAHALKRDSAGRAASPIGAAMDLVT
jgi:hypothetical protein